MQISEVCALTNSNFGPAHAEEADVHFRFTGLRVDAVEHDVSQHVGHQ